MQLTKSENWSRLSKIQTKMRTVLSECVCFKYCCQHILWKQSNRCGLCWAIAWWCQDFIRFFLKHCCTFDISTLKTVINNFLSQLHLKFQFVFLWWEYLREIRYRTMLIYRISLARLLECRLHIYFCVSVCLCVWERKRVCVWVCVCVWKRERERERGRESGSGT